MTDEPKQPIYMSENEVQNIISSFRSALLMYTTEVEKLKQKNEALHTDLQGELIKSTSLQEELKGLQLLFQKKSTVLDSYQEKIGLVEAGLSKISSIGTTSSQEFQTEIQKFNETNLLEEQKKLDFVEILKKMIQKVKEIEIHNQALRKNTEELQEDLERMNSGERISIMCMHCKRDYIPKQNREGDCVYHSGKLKYYSCKGCGDDAYYNCCNKCLKCSEGCRRGKHVPL